MVIACLDTLYNLPVIIIFIATSILRGKVHSPNHLSWKNAHDRKGGSMPGLSLSSIPKIPARVWGSTGWYEFDVKWIEWIYVLHAVVFFGVFGTTPKMMEYYRSALWFIPERFGYKRRREIETISDVEFNSSPIGGASDRPVCERRHDSPPLLEVTIDSGANLSDSIAEAGVFSAGCSLCAAESMIYVKAEEIRTTSGE